MGLTEPLQWFFVLHWEEVFDPQTPDTWQARTVNFPTILRETVSAIDVCKDFPEFKHNIPPLLEEAASIAQNDPVLGEHFPLARKQLPTDYQRYTSAESDEHLSDLRRCLQATLGQLQTYQSVLLEELRALLLAGDQQQKKRLYALTLALATEWASHGYSVLHLSDGAAALRQPRVSSFGERFDRFSARYDGKLRRYRCRLNLVVPQAAEIDYLQPREIQIVLERPYGPLLPEEQTFYGKAAEGEAFADIVTKALDPVIARRVAEEKVAGFFAAINLFLPNQQPDFRGKSALVWCEEDQGSESPRPITLPLRRFRPIGFRAVADPPRQIGHYLEMRSNLQSSEFEQIDSALQYHRLALQAPSDEARLVNFWISLETICRRSRGRSSIIHSICEQVVPSVAVGNVRKLLTSLATYLQGFRRASQREDIRKLFPNASEDSLPIGDLLDLLGDQNRLRSLGDILAHHPLLLFRVFKAWELFKDRKELRDMLTQHAKNVDWQLRRIYRVRNQVMHRGQGSLVISPLIQHLHSYVGVTLHNLLFDLRDHSAWSVPDALRHRRIVFTEFVNLLEGTEPVPRAVLLDPAAVLARRVGPYFWS